MRDSDKSFKFDRVSVDDVDVEIETKPSRTDRTKLPNLMTPQWLKRRHICFLAYICWAVMTSILALKIHEITSALASQKEPTKLEILFKKKTLHALCYATSWQENLYLNCTNLIGNTRGKGGRGLGLANVRNDIVTCLRMAIDAGIGFIMPKVAVRSEENPLDFDQWADLSYVIDEENLIEIMQRECPQLNVLPNNAVFNNTILTQTKAEKDIYYCTYTIGRYYDYLKDILTPHGINLSSNIDYPSVVWEHEVIFRWNFSTENHQIHTSLMNAVKYAPKLLTLGQSITEKIKVDYLGFHLRAEADALWYNYTTQVEKLMDIIQSSKVNIKTIYVAVGNLSLYSDFTTDMSRYGLTVLSKWSIASDYDEILTELNQLKFDQLAVVDYHILLNSTYFVGLGMSSYSFAIAYDRGHGDIAQCNCSLEGPIEKLFDPCY
ncbi:MAG: hypothetical protein EOP45_01725 [Sphingobacteriaceae bacterium]|nr:MAG: hypothetical protein EOP45_01725 [Sphingobacteriaceae bacterium]